MGKTLLLLAIVPAFAAAASAQDARVTIPGQGQGTITFFDARDFRGSAATFRSNENRVRLPFNNAGSIRVEGSWRVCTGVNYSGRCVTLSRDYRDARSLGLYTVGSVQPLSGGWYPPGGGWGNWSGPVGGPSLRGENAVFFAMPSIRGQRVSACQGANYSGCEQRTADRLCNYSGYNRAIAHDRVRGGREWYLSDVLCSRR